MKEFIAWTNLRRRCHATPGNKDYSRYAGRGINVCARWDSSFDNFLADMGESPSAKHSLDRIDNDGDYEPGNCRWATATEQSNNRSFNVRLTFRGETLTTAQWCTKLGIDRSVLCMRLRAGWSTERALTELDGRNTVMLTLDGTTRSMREWSMLLGLKRGTVWLRLQRGASVAEALRPIPSRHKRIMLTHNGETRSLTEWSKITGIKKKTISDRLKHGDTPEQALRTNLWNR